jgi:hypothetical protein
MPIPPPDFDLIFRDGGTFTEEIAGAAVITLTEVGKLELPTGRVVAADPMAGLGDQAEPFVQTVAPGAYPVVVARALWTENDGDHRVIAAKLVVRDEPVAAWELALVQDQDPAELGEDEMFGFGVDTATACFVDAAHADLSAALLGAEADEGLVWDTFIEAEDAAVAAVVTDPDSGQCVAVFNTGWGDGAYPTWVGRTAAGEVACFAIEFFVVPDDRFPEDDDENLLFLDDHEHDHDGHDHGHEGHDHSGHGH